MDIAVLVKQIPDPAVAGDLTSDYTFKRDGKIVMDDADLYGVELALQLRDDAGSGEVTVISMSPGQETVGVKNALAMGADKAIVVSDEGLKGAHSLATAKVLDAAIAKAGNVDLIIAGTESSDGYAGVMPAQLGTLRNVSVLSYATSVKVNGDEVVITRQTDSGSQTVSAKFPALISVTAGSTEPRYPNFKGIMAAKTKQLDFFDLAGLGVNVGDLKIEEQSVFEVDQAESRSAGEKIEDEDLGVAKIVELLEQTGAL